MKGATWVMLTWSAMLLGISSIWVISISSIWVISISSIVISTLLCYIYPHMTILISAFDPHISIYMTTDDNIQVLASALSGLM